MPVLADGDDHLGAYSQIVKLRLHVEALAHLAEQQREVGGILQVFGRGKMHPHEEQPGVGVAVLLRIHDVAARLVQQTGYRVHDARRIGAR